MPCASGSTSASMGCVLMLLPYLCERDGTNNENLPETHEILRRIRSEVDARYPDRMLLAEANQWPEDTRPYFGEGDECHMAFHFPLMPRMYMGLGARRSPPRHGYSASDAGGAHGLASGRCSCATMTS